MSGAIDDYEVLFRETNNPLFVFEALECCRRDAPLPGWIWDYLTDATRYLAARGQPAWYLPDPTKKHPRMGLLDLADAVCAGTMSAGKAMALALRALGLQRGRNTNAMAEFALARQAFDEAWHVDLTRAGVKNTSAVAEIEAHYGEARGAGDRQIKRRLALARLLWEAQANKK